MGTGERGSERALGLAALGVLGFSFTLPMTRIVVRGLDPVLAASLRALAAAVLAAVALRIGRRTRPTPAQLRSLVLVAGGVVLGFPLLTSYAARLVPASHSAVFTGLLPLVTAGLAVARVGERPAWRYWACSLLGLSAVVAFALHEGGGGLHAADLYLLAANAVAAVAYVEGAVLARAMPGWAVISWALLVAAPLMVVLSVVTLARTPPESVTFGQWSAFAYTAGVSMFAAFMAWYAGMAGAGIARAGQLQLLQPVLAVLWAWPLLGEEPTAAVGLTGAAVLLAVALGRGAPIAGTSVTSGPGPAPPL